MSLSVPGENAHYIPPIIEFLDIEEFHTFLESSAHILHNDTPGRLTTYTGVSAIGRSFTAVVDPFHGGGIVTYLPANDTPAIDGARSASAPTMIAA